MVSLVRTTFNFTKNAFLNTSVRSLSITKPLELKQIREQKDGESLIIEAINVPSPRTELLVRAEKLPEGCTPVPSDPTKKPCYLCALGLDVKHTDVLILSQFVRTDGCMLPRRITGLCRRQQIKIGKMVSMAQKAGLMINLTPANCKKNPRRRRDWKKFNTYFDENTIFMKHIPDPNLRLKR